MPASSLAFTHTVTERFLRYVVIDTQSDPNSPTCPSTEKQKNLGRVLAAELQAMGIADAHLDEHGYVYATIPANTDKQVPVICFCSHMDTSPDAPGAAADAFHRHGMTVRTTETPWRLDDADRALTDRWLTERQVFERDVNGRMQLVINDREERAGG